MANPAEDLFRHSPKKGEDETNIPPKNSLTPSADDTHAPASQNGDGYPLAGVQGGANSPLAIKNQSMFSTQPIIFISRKDFKFMEDFEYQQIKYLKRIFRSLEGISLLLILLLLASCFKD